MTNTTVSYHIANADQTDTPFLAVYPDLVKANVLRLVGLFQHTDQIRPHVKTHKCPQVVQSCMDAGITKFKCATIAEAEMLALAGARDVLMAYQPVGPKVERFINLMITHPCTKFSCLVDNQIAAKYIADEAARFKVTVRLWLDLNVGMNRTGSQPEQAILLYDFCKQLPAVKVIGLHAYDGHIIAPDRATRMAQAEKGFSAVKKLCRELLDKGANSLRLAAGSTPTLQFYAQQPDVECSPGTFIYWDQHYQTCYPELGFQNAVVVVTRVISNPSEATTCLDLGYKAISSESPESERIDFIAYPGASIILQSEEHLLIATGINSPQIGEVVYGIPYHIGRTCNLYDVCAVVTDSAISDHWSHTARKRQWFTNV
jgi:D-serine deaminase-like pyridoxal phosphate-dependent protein